MTLPHVTHHHTSTVPDPKTELVKSDRQKVFDKLRNDWSFDPRGVSSRPKAEEKHDATAAPGPGEKVSDARWLEGGDMLREEDVEEWRERTYASSDPSDDEDDSCPSIGAGKNMNGSAKGAGNGDSGDDPRRRQSRKRRRRVRLQEELEWNEGLRFWEARRDAWCCARRVSISSPDVTLNRKDSSDDSPTTTTTSTSKSLLDSAQEQTITTQHDSLTLLPLAPPLLPPTDPTRAIISPSYYPSIFNKVVTQSLTPSIPINLSHMVPALVQGWKTNGDWPPKSSMPVPSAVALDHSVKSNGSSGAGGKISGAKERLMRRYQKHVLRDGEGNSNGHGKGEGRAEVEESSVSSGGKGTGMLRKVLRFSLSSTGGDEKG